MYELVKFRRKNCLKTAKNWPLKKSQEEKITMTIEELQQKYESLLDNCMQQTSDIVTLKFEKEKLETENEKLKNEIDSVYEDNRMLNVKHDELKSEYEDSEYDRDSLYWEYWELKEKCETVNRVANYYLMNQADLEELLGSIVLLNSDN